MRKKLISLSEEGLEKVWEKNEKLKDKIRFEYKKSEMDYIEDILEQLRDSLGDWEIGFDNQGGNFIIVDKPHKFTQGVQDIQSMFGIFEEDEYTEIEELIKKEDIDGIKDLLLAILDQITAEPDEGYLFDYFICSQMYTEDKGYYIDEDYILYKESTESFK